MKNSADFPPRGLTYFWFLNDHCEDALMDSQIDAFAAANVATVCLHPRDGLLFPYGGSDWFAFVRGTVEKLAAKGIGTWLYDEDPFPSGNAGGRIALDHPEFVARKITMHQAAPAEIGEDGLWFFPAHGKLLLCGLIDPTTGDVVADWTERVGVIRRTWTMMKGWNSRWYYPATPLYVSDRAKADNPEYALKAGRIPDGRILCAFTLEPSGRDSTWRNYADTLNPDATNAYIESTHEKYRKSVGHMFGREITAMFTDESKYFGKTPWTPGMFEEFQRTYGYDLRTRLHDLFSTLETPSATRTRLQYRQWCGKRFETAWLVPVSEWCRRNGLKVVGHMSPEDDPVSQAFCLSNLMPLQKHLSLAGFDLIIPAVGDKRHPMINVGVVSTVSSAQQHGIPGVMSESLACSGTDCPIETVYRILNWQTVMGMTTPVVHGVFHSLREEREFECPPDFGPWTRFGDGLAKLAKDLKPIQDMLLEATQIAPVAILWPIKSFHLRNSPWQAEPGGLREELTDFLLGCLEAHVGVHFLDEGDFHDAVETDGLLRIGRASYSHVIVPCSDVWTERTWKKLNALFSAGFSVFQYGTTPRFIETERDVTAIPPIPFPRLLRDEIGTQLPKLLDIKAGDPDNIRVTSWTKDGWNFHLLCYLGEGTMPVAIHDVQYELSSGSITVMSAFPATRNTQSRNPT